METRVAVHADHTRTANSLISGLTGRGTAAAMRPAQGESKMRMTLLSAFLLAMVGCSGGAGTESPSVATQEQNQSAVQHAQNAVFYQIDESGGVLHLQIPPWLADKIAQAYGKPELADLFRVQIEQANLKLATLDPNQSFEPADAIVEALNGVLQLKLHPDPRTLVFSGPAAE
jgi:hypothetical protein